MQQRTEPITRLDEVRAPHNVVAAVAGLRRARSLIEKLEQSAVESSHISLLGAQPTSEESQMAEGSFDEPAGSAAIGGASGAAVGAGAGALAGIAVGVPGVGPAVAAGVWAVFGGALGASLGGVTSLGLSRAWEQTFADVKAGNVAVGVHSDDVGEIERAAETMDEFDVLSVNRFDD